MLRRSIQGLGLICMAVSAAWRFAFSKRSAWPQAVRIR